MTPFLKKSVQLNILTILFAFFAPNGISELSENTNVADWSVHKFGLLELARRPRETIVGNGCPKGRFRYYGKCKSYKELRNSDYNDIDVTNEAETFTPTTTVREDKFVETIETDINLSIVPLSRPDVITKSNFVKLNSDVTLRTMEKSTRLGTELNPSVTTQTPEITLLKPDVSVSSVAMTEPSQLKATEPTSALSESDSARTESRPTFEDPKTDVTELNQFIDELSSTVVDTRYTGTIFNPILIEHTWTELFSNLTSEPTSSLTDTQRTVKETAPTTTDVPRKGVPNVFHQNDKASNISLEVKYFMFTLMFVVSCVIILNWKYEKLYVILYRRRDQETRVVHLSKEQESMV